MYSWCTCLPLKVVVTYQCICIEAKLSKDFGVKLFDDYRQGISLTPTSTGQLQFPLINMSQLKAHLDKNVKLEPMETVKGDTTGGLVSTSTITLPAQVWLLCKSWFPVSSYVVFTSCVRNFISRKIAKTLF